MDGRGWAFKEMRFKRPKVLLDCSSQCAVWSVGSYKKKKAISLAASELITKRHVDSMVAASILIAELFPNQPSKHLKLPLVAPPMPDVQRAGKRWRVADSNASGSNDPVEKVSSASCLFSPHSFNCLMSCLMSLQLSSCHKSQAFPMKFCATKDLG